LGKHSSWIFQPGDTFRIKGLPKKAGRREIVKSLLTGNLYAETSEGVRFRLFDHAAEYRETGYHFRHHTGLTKDTVPEEVQSAKDGENWVFADGDRFFFEVGEYECERRVSTRPDVPGAKGPILRGESDFLVTDTEGNYSGRLPQDADMYRMHGHNFRHHPEFAYRAPGTEEPTEEELDARGVTNEGLEDIDPGGYFDTDGSYVPVWRADETASVPIEEADPVLVWLLRHAGEEWGPSGVAEAAAQLAGWVGPL